jgi:hypothetical protein
VKRTTRRIRRVTSWGGLVRRECASQTDRHQPLVGQFAPARSGLPSRSKPSPHGPNGNARVPALLPAAVAAAGRPLRSRSRPHPRPHPRPRANGRDAQNASPSRRWSHARNNSLPPPRRTGRRPSGSSRRSASGACPKVYRGNSGEQQPQVVAHWPAIWVAQGGDKPPNG